MNDKMVEFLMDLLDVEEWMIPNNVPGWAIELAERMISRGWVKP